MWDVQDYIINDVIWVFEYKNIRSYSKFKQ